MLSSGAQVAVPSPGSGGAAGGPEKHTREVQEILDTNRELERRLEAGERDAAATEAELLEEILRTKREHIRLQQMRDSDLQQVRQSTQAERGAQERLQAIESREALLCGEVRELEEVNGELSRQGADHFR